MAQTAAYLVERVIPWVPTRHWVVSVPIPLRYWMAASQELTAKVHTIIRTTIGQYYVNQVVIHGVPRDQVQPGSVTFIQRFGSAINLHLHFHLICLAGVYLDRTEASHKPRFVKVEPPTAAEIPAVVQKSSRRVSRTLRHRGDRATGRDGARPTGHDPWRDDAPELARPRAASVQQRLALGERAGPQVRRIGARVGAEGEAPTLPGTRWARGHGFALHANPQILAHHRAQLERLRRETARGAVSLERLIQATNGALVYPFPHPWADGPTGRRRSPVALLETLAALGPLPRGHLGRSGGGLAAHSSVRRVLTPPPRQHGIDAPEAHPESPRWRWARLWQRVFALALARGPHARRGGLETPPASAARGGPAPEGPGACPPSRLRLGLRLRCPRCRPGGEAAWPRGGSVLSGQQPARAARPGSLSPPGSPRLAQPQPLRSVVVWARGLQPAQTVPDG